MGSTLALVAVCLVGQGSGSAFEDYQRAVSLLERHPIRRQLNVFPGDGSELKTSYLDLCREVRSALRPSFALLASGNRKPLVLPNADTPLRLTDLAKALRFSVHADLAEDRGTEAGESVATMLSALWRARAHGPSWLIAGAVDLIAFGVAEGALPRAPLNFIEPVFKALEMRKSGWGLDPVWDWALKEDVELAKLLVNANQAELETSLDSEWIPDLLRRSSVERQRLAERYVSIRRDAIQTLREQSGRPLREWAATSPHPASGDALLDKMLSTEVDDFKLKQEAQRRVKSQLLSLTLKGYAHRWNHKQWPTKLADFADAQERTDPLAGEEFRFEREGAGIVIWSEGSKLTGPIRLRGA